MYRVLIEAAPVIWPVVATLIAALLFLRTIRRRSSGLDVFELGVVYAALVVLYAVFPFLTYLSGDLAFSVLSDNRLFQFQPSPRQLAPIYWYYFLYFAAFALAYAAVRRAPARRGLRIVLPSRYTLGALVITLVAIKVFFFAVKLAYGLRDSEIYEETYLMYQGLPRVLEQSLNHLGGMTFALQIVIMVLLICTFRRYKYWIGMWLFLELTSTFIGGVGSRTNLFILFTSLLASYHYVVKRIRTRTAVAMGMAALLAFLSLGVLRSIREVSSGTSVNIFGYANEFEIIFSNAYDVSQLKAAGEVRDVFPAFYFADFFALVPQQLFPVKKIDTAAWYVNTFYPAYAEVGGGLAFGAVPEAILGLGWVDVLWRGAVVGMMFGWLYRRFATRQQTLWSCGFYIWVLSFAYQCFRGTTFALVPRAFYQFLPLLIVIPILSGVVSLVGARQFTLTRDLLMPSLAASVPDTDLSR